MENVIKVSFCAADNMHPTLPTKSTSGAAAYDLHACIDKPIPIQPGKRVLIETGWKVQMPATMAAYVMSRSGLAWKNGIAVLNAPGLIDSDYRGTIKVVLINHGDEPFFVLPNMRVAQLMFVASMNTDIVVIETGDLFAETSRGAGGFGSTGV
jgi:dUTP pyrophosphatase